MVPGNLLHACERGPSESIPEKGSAITAGAGDFGALGFSGAPRRSIFASHAAPARSPGWRAWPRALGERFPRTEALPTRASGGVPLCFDRSIIDKQDPIMGGFEANYRL
jgi:hypothetical protein